MHLNSIASILPRSLTPKLAAVFAVNKQTANQTRFGTKIFAPVSAAQAFAQTTSSGMMLLANVNALQKLAKLAKLGTLRSAFATVSLKNALLILTTFTSSTEINANANVTHQLKLAQLVSFTIPMFVHASAPQKNVQLICSGTKSTANASA